MNQYFDIGRLKKLFSRQLMLNYGNIVLIGGVITAILLFIAVPFTRLGNDRTPYEILYLVFYGVLAILETNGMFNNIFRKEKNIEYLMLPASTEEKFIVKIVINVILLPLFLMAVFLLASIIGQLLNLVLWGVRASIFNPGINYIWIALPHIIVGQSVFIAGASIFKKMSIVKTILSLWGLSFVFGIVAGLLFRLIFSKYFTGWEFDEFFFSGTPAFLDRWGSILKYIGLTMYYLLIPFFYLISYFRMKEVQVSDGI